MSFVQVESFAVNIQIFMMISCDKKVTLVLSVGIFVVQHKFERAV